MSKHAKRIAAAQAEVHATCLRMVNDKLVVGSAGNVSVRLDADRLVVSAGGMLYEHLTASDHPVVNLADGSFEGPRKPTSEMALHLRLMRDHPAVQAIVHTHSRHAAAFAIARVDLPFVCNENIGPSSEFIYVTDYAAPGTIDLGEQAATTFARQPGSKAVLLANHGVVALGDSAEAAYVIAAQVEWIAEVTYLASTLDPKLTNVAVLPLDQQNLIASNYQFTIARPGSAAKPNEKKRRSR